LLRLDAAKYAFVNGTKCMDVLPQQPKREFALEIDSPNLNLSDKIMAR